MYNFKKIQVVPTGKEFVDIVLTRTQRKTPTQLHSHLPVSAIRRFYMRKVKFTQATINEKLDHILKDFPILDEIHPFYADLMNVLYDRDHYKLALGQVNTARHLIDNVAKDYIRLLKFGDSLYRCKQLKRAALGRMVKVLRRQGASFEYLEEVRKHMARLPNIDPATRTLLMCGYPNVGKSSFMNKLTRANVEVQPYAFTTKSLLVGHTDYKYLRWQVIDTPGILDHPLEDRNTIEMQAITAMAHLRCTIIYFVDISEQCGYSIKQQCELFHSIMPLFANKPLVIAMNKIDARRPEDLRPDERALIEGMIASVPGSLLLPMSSMSEEGVTGVKEAACDMLLALRTEMKMKGVKKDEIAHRLHVALPEPRDDRERPAYIPETVVLGTEGKVARRKLSEWEEQQRLYQEFDPDYSGMDWRQWYLLDDPDWRYDTIPEFMDGENVADWMDPELEEKLAELLAEEIERERQLGDMDIDNDYTSELTGDQLERLQRIREMRQKIINEHRLKKIKNGSILPKHKMSSVGTVGEFEDQLAAMGIDAEAALKTLREDARERSRSRSRSQSQARGRKRSREEMEEDRRLSKTPKPGEGFKDLKQKLKAEKLARNALKLLNRDGRQGESDRRIPDEKPKHLFAGKRGIGKTDRR
eukprot:TRINITY_DN2004_c0_g1_i1.p1 TRINITY_DN2004_c0_g1~~TRINITY_DN2004_c0_g1_i1.p1  ORF type:complete len:644 (+),score=176.82 TRINITY_DN2004_c0_g1_i1:239-2170(+)